MNYELTISDHNRQAHLDIDQAIETRKNGQFTFTLRVNNYQIADCVVIEYIDASKYLQLKSITLEEV